MVAECNQQTFGFHPLGQREVVGRFDGGTISSDGGGVLLREVEVRTAILRQFAACFTDHRDADLIEHTVEQLVAQRVYALALGYEDLLDHDDLRHDPLLAALAGKTDPSGQDRLRARDRGKPLAGKSTLNRLELTPAGAGEESRYKKIVLHMERVEAMLVDVFLQAHSGAAEPPKRIVLDVDSTDARLHGHQLGRFFHGYYDCYCYLPLYIFAASTSWRPGLRRRLAWASCGRQTSTGPPERAGEPLVYNARLPAGADPDALLIAVRAPRIPVALCISPKRPRRCRAPNSRKPA